MKALNVDSFPFKGEGQDGDGFISCERLTHPHPNPPLKGEGVEC